ncbi:unnamed protein product [Urochloa decumbens]|uniref:F-box associated domain-containing protein n=1 Tax=Urochloa decumbens TaxID=240449 RepID=A0ABC8XFA7_9POAL
MGSSMSTTAPSSESLPDDALAEILLRVPPHPNCLARASLAGKGPRRVTTSPEFLRAFRKRHNSAPPPLLGFFHDDGDLPSNFLPVGDSPNRVSAAAFDHMDEEPGWRVVDSRHGRVLLRSPDRLRFLVWEPMAGRRSYVDAPPPDHADHYKFSSAALVCTAAHEEEEEGRHHIDCHDCPLSVLFVVTPGRAGTTVVYLCSPEQGVPWEEVASGDFSPLTVTERPVDLQRNVVYWTMAGAMGIQEGILAFELESHRLYQIGQPPYIFDAEHEHVQVMEEEGSRLGLVVACGLTLQLWVLLEYNGEGTERWEMQGEIYLDDELFPGEPMFEDYYMLWILGMDSSNIFLRTEVGIFEVDLLTEQSKRLWDGHEIEALYPYRSFYRQGIIQEDILAPVLG